jgi:hypothetical protein
VIAIVHIHTCTFETLTALSGDWKKLIPSFFPANTVVISTTTKKIATTPDHYWFSKYGLPIVVCASAAAGPAVEASLRCDGPVATGGAPVVPPWAITLSTFPEPIHR